MNNTLGKTQSIALLGMFGAIIFLLTFTPLGFIPVPVFGSATILHIPVIVGAIVLGPKMGAVLGLMFGFSSMLFATFMSPHLNAFAFTPFRPVPGTEYGSPWALVIAFVPRILIGVVSPLVFYGLMKVLPKKIEALGIAIAAVVSSMTNTLLVLHLIYFIFRDPWTYARAGAGNPAPQITYAFIAGIIAGAGVAEAIVAAVIVPAVCIALFAVAARMPRRHQEA